MDLSEQVKQAVIDGSRRLAEDQDFKQLQQFYEEKKEQGIALKRAPLPLLDTVGRGMHLFLA